MTNRLAQAQSLYLRKHGENPIDWWPWIPEALETARATDRPIFLSIGYSSCHWCTVMEGEAFSDPAVAAYMNAEFLPIKVDREERPDIDQIYIQAVQAMIGQAGWPLNVFLDPADLAPFYGGTYFPLGPRYGRPGFLEVLQAVRRFYDREKTKLADTKDQLVTFLRRQTLTSPLTDVSGNLLTHAYAQCQRVLSYSGPGTRFPMIPYAQAVLWASRGALTDDHPAVQRGLNLVLGGIYDHVAGGFHRYTVDPTWTVPHFEKMLYDNGQILEYLANLWSAGVQDAAIERAVMGTVAWLVREMRAPEGFFWAAQDADTFVSPTDAEPEEGRFYVWRYSELQEILTPEQWEAMTAAFDLDPSGNFEGFIVLQRREAGPLSPAVESALENLFQVRYGTRPAECSTFPPALDAHTARHYPWPGRIPPVTDTKLIVAWNSLVISGLARCAAVFGQPVYLQLAQDAARYILQAQRPAGRLYRLNYDGEVAVLAQAEDYALLIQALLDVYQAGQGTGAQEAGDWLTLAEELQAEFEAQCGCLEGGGYFSGPADASADLLVRERPMEDGALPSANGVALMNLVRLFLATEQTRYLDGAERGLRAFGAAIRDNPQGVPSLVMALDQARHPLLVRTPMATVAHLAQQFFPTVVYRHEGSEGIARPAGLVCEGLLCRAPAPTVEQLVAQIRQYQALP